jgi:hypothetical protein
MDTISGSKVLLGKSLLVFAQAIGRTRQLAPGGSTTLVARRGDMVRDQRLLAAHLAADYTADDRTSHRSGLRAVQTSRVSADEASGWTREQQSDCRPSHTFRDSSARAADDGPRGRAGSHASGPVNIQPRACRSSSRIRTIVIAAMIGNEDARVIPGIAILFDLGENPHEVIGPVGVVRVVETILRRRCSRIGRRNVDRPAHRVSSAT